MAARHPLLPHYPADHLFRTPRIAEQRIDMLADRVSYPGLRLVIAPRQSQCVGLLWAIALIVASQLPAVRSRITPNDLGNLRLRMDMTGFLERVNLVSFLSGKLRVAHLRSSLL